MADHEKRDIDEVSGIATTGHEWDGIKELDNPLPRWWLIIFYATIALSVVYWVMMPAWPGWPGLAANADHTTGLRNHSDRAAVARDVADLRAARAGDFEKLISADIAALDPSDPLLAFAMQAGESAFGDNCATCHGSGAQGAKGYPNLNDNEWIWGGALADIEHTLRVGVRSNHPDTRYSLMPAFGRDKILTGAEIDAVTDHVLSLTGAAAASPQGAAIYAQSCASCHGAEGGGDRTFGAPSLIDAVWLNGSERADVRAQIVSGRGGVMPTWEGRLDDGAIRALAIYVHSLGGGEAAPPAASAPSAAEATVTPAAAPGAPAPPPTTQP